MDINILIEEPKKLARLVQDLACLRSVYTGIKNLQDLYFAENSANESSYSDIRSLSTEYIKEIKTIFEDAESKYSDGLGLYDELLHAKDDLYSGICDKIIDVDQDYIDKVELDISKQLDIKKDLEIALFRIQIDVAFQTVIDFIKDKLSATQLNIIKATTKYADDTIED